MKKVFLTLVFLISCMMYGQKPLFLVGLKEVPTTQTARVMADSLARHLKTPHTHYKTSTYGNGLLRIVYSPNDMTEEQLKAQKDYEDCFVVDFKLNDKKTYTFDMAKAHHETLFPVWKHFFKYNASSDKKVQRYRDDDYGINYSFLNRGDNVWAIGR